MVGNPQMNPCPSGQIQLDAWPPTKERVAHILDGLVKHNVFPLDVFITEGKPWILTRPCVPQGKWCKQFPSFRLAGEDSEPKTGKGKKAACEGILIP